MLVRHLSILLRPEMQFAPRSIGLVRMEPLIVVQQPQANGLNVVVFEVEDKVG